MVPDRIEVVEALPRTPNDVRGDRRRAYGWRPAMSSGVGDIDSLQLVEVTDRVQTELGVEVDDGDSSNLRLSGPRRPRVSDGS
jgi:hypothetical protein